MFRLTLLIFVIHLFYGIQALECGFSVARGHFDEVQQLLQNCVEIKDFDGLTNNNFSTTPEFVTRTDGPNVRNNFSSSLESQSDETDHVNPQVNTARIAQIRLRNPTVVENRNDDARTIYNIRDEIDQQNVPRNRNESFRAQTPIITIQPVNSNVSTVPDYSSDQDDDQDKTNVTDELEQSQETNVTDNHCIIHCLLEQMKVLNDAGFPDRQKLAKELLKKVVGRDIEDFFQDSINDCYRQTDDKYLDSCEFSTELILCLVEKGKANCNDWPVGIFSYQP